MNNKLEEALDIARRVGGSVHVEAKAPKKRDDGLVEINTKHSPAVRKQLKQLAIDADKTQQQLMAEALNLLPEIA